MEDGLEKGQAPRKQKSGRRLQATVSALVTNPSSSI